MVWIEFDIWKAVLHTNGSALKESIAVISHQPISSHRLHKMRLNVLLLACCVLLATGGNAGDPEAFDCDANAPKAFRELLLSAINEMRTLFSVSNVTYEETCDLGAEAFSGVSGGDSIHRNFEVERAFDGTWKETLNKMISAVQNKINDANFEKVGCSIGLNTSDDGEHNIKLKCAFKTKNDEPR
ncbi:hypothetical protein GCK32_007512 [Trichostrongylus colubriformis]|uniref:Uncharacterized protein n=1 Tax=Trichostrongylus colubriformis TaxID=6319 RepID=A0AAN8F2S8_TRICO